MSRSYKKPYVVPYHFKCRKDKKIMHKRERAMVRNLLNSDKNYEDIQPLFPIRVEEVMDVWSMSMDGFQMFIGNLDWWKNNKHWIGNKLVK